MLGTGQKQIEQRRCRKIPFTVTLKRRHCCRIQVGDPTVRDNIR